MRVLGRVYRVMSEAYLSTARSRIILVYFYFLPGFSVSCVNASGTFNYGILIGDVVLSGLYFWFTKLDVNASVTFTLRRPYGGRRTPKSGDSCGCRRNSAVAAGPPYGEFLCFTGRRGGRRIIARSYNFFHFYVRRINLSHRSRAVDASTATVRRTYGGRTEALRQSVASV